MSKCHVFLVDDAVLYGIEKSVILYNLRFWLDKVKANDKDRSKHEGYYWTFNSVTAFKELFPYLSEGQLQRHLKGLENDGVILAGVFNKKGYDRTKWYSMPEFKIDNIIHQNQQDHSLNMASDFTGIDEPIPYVNADVSADVISNIKDKEKPKEKPINFNPNDYPLPSFIGYQNWCDFVEMRRSIKKPLSKLACSKAVNTLTKMDQNGFDANDSLDNSVMSSYQGLFETKKKTANTTKGLSYDNQQPKQSQARSFDDNLDAQLAADEGWSNEYTVN